MKFQANLVIIEKTIKVAGFIAIYFDFMVISFETNFVKVDQVGDFITRYFNFVVIISCLYFKHKDLFIMVIEVEYLQFKNLQIHHLLN